MKKILTAVLLAFSILACKGKEEAKGPKTEGLKGSIVVQAEDTWQPYYEAAIKRVKEKNPDADIQLKVIGSFDHLDIIDKTDATNKDVADVFALPLDKMESLNSKSVLASFDAKALADKIGGFKDFDNGLGGQLKKDGSYVAFPMNIETLAVGLNKKNAAAQGIDVTKDIDLAKLSPDVAMVPVFNAWYAVAITNAFDVELLGKDGDKFFSDLTKNWDELTPDQQKMFEGLFNYWKASHEKKLPMFDEKAVDGYVTDNFNSGKTGSVRIVGPWDANPMSEALGDDFDVIGLNHATWEGKPLKHWKSGWALGINSRDEEDKDKMALAEAVIAEIMNPKYAGDMYKITGKIMPNVSKEEYEKMDKLSPLDKKVLASILESYDVAVSRPLFEEWGQVWDTWKNSIISWEAKKPKTAQDAYKEVQASFKALLTNLGQ